MIALRPATGSTDGQHARCRAGSSCTSNGGPSRPSRGVRRPDGRHNAAGHGAWRGVGAMVAWPSFGVSEPRATFYGSSKAKR